jgi:hypothetical protein
VSDGSPMALCYICKERQVPTTVTHPQGAFITTQSCPVCGQWKGMSDVVIPELNATENARLVPYLAAHIRRENARGVKTVELTTDNWRGFAEEHARTPIMHRLDLLLRWFERRSKHAGDYVTFSRDIYPLIDAENDKEVMFLAETLVTQQLLERRQNRINDLRITGKGWEYLQPLTSGGVPGTCFVAMSFDPSLDPAFDDGIYPALDKDCGYHADRVDRNPHNEKIDDRIMAGIRAAQFVVADFTGHRQSVYYEAGFAQGLGRTVIRTCRDTDFDHLHFDTRQFVHLKWSTPAQLREMLANHVSATIGKWQKQ